MVLPLKSVFCNLAPINLTSERSFLENAIPVKMQPLHSKFFFFVANSVLLAGVFLGISNIAKNSLAVSDKLSSENPLFSTADILTVALFFGAPPLNFFFIVLFIYIYY